MLLLSRLCTLVAHPPDNRSGTYSGAHSGPVRQLLLLGDLLLSLGERDGRLAVWAVGQYDKPQVGGG